MLNLKVNNMTQEDKELLLKDLSARLPHGVIVSTPKGNGHLCSINQTIFGNEYGVNIEATKRDYFNDNECDIKPYLRPMSSMTEEEKHDLLVTTVGIECVKYFQVLSDGSIDNTDAAHQDLYNFTMHWINFDGINTTSYLDWLNAHHFDYRGLIKKELAIDCTSLNIY